MLRAWAAVAVSVILLFIPAFSSAQTPETTIRANSRLIVVDVVATNKNEQPLTDLRAEEFTVLEDGKPQNLNSFELHVSKSGAHVNPPALPPDQYTNANEVPDGPINILLVDAMNSSFLNQATTRNAVVHLLTTLPPGQPMAIFVLGDRLRMIQGFTTDSTLLRKAAMEYKPETTVAQNRTAATASAGESITKAQRQGSFVEGLQKVIEKEQASIVRDRVTETMNAFKQLARAVSGYSGRKNIVWLSGSFPLNLRLRYSAFATEDFERQAREVTNLLAAAKIAIYPVDIRGMDSRTSLASDDLMTFRVFAEDTGGRAFYNSNDIEVAMSRSIELGSTYYTLSYTPRNKKWNGNFREIKVEVNRKDTKLFYRRGYYAIDSAAVPQVKRLERDFQLAMIAESPVATGIIVRARVVERKPDGTTIVEFGLAGNQLRLRDGEGNPFAAKYGFGIMGWDDQGKIAGMGSEVWNLPGDPAIVSKIEKEGWTHRLSVKIPNAATHLRVAVQDQSVGNIGTVDIPLTGTL
jgi:VWFA-related protein